MKLNLQLNYNLTSARTANFEYSQEQHMHLYEWNCYVTHVFKPATNYYYGTKLDVYDRWLIQIDKPLFVRDVMLSMITFSCISNTRSSTPQDCTPL